MPVVIMTVTAKARLEKADNLTHYTFESPAQGTLEIIANDTNNYEIGDTAGVAIVGTKLPGLEIKPRNVFGIASSGMACGPVDGAIDTDVSDQFDADKPERKWTVTIEVEVDAAYEEDASKAALKKARSEGKVVSAV
jgi:tRNA-binding EMAP/Myf-like protein